MTEDRRLVTRAAQGEEDAFASLVARYRPDVLRTARSILMDAAAAEDVAQEAILRLHASLPGLRGNAELSTWLYRVTLNLCRDHLRRIRRGARDVDVSEAAGAPGLRVEPGAEAAMDVERARTAVRDAIERLPPEQREVVSLRFIDDLPYSEIARITGTPQGTVASRVFRALERLGRELEPKHLEVVK